MAGESTLRGHVLSNARRMANLEDELSEPAPRSKQMANTPFSGGSSFDRGSSPKDNMAKYWRQFETTPMVRESIRSFSQQVTEPGYRVEAPDLSDDEIEQLVHWLRRSAITEGEIGKDITALIQKAIVQREVRGTAMIEIVPAEEQEDKLAEKGTLKLVNAETMDYFTAPQQAILPAPDQSIEGVPTTESGDTAAYIQETGSGRNKVETFFSRDEILKLTRDADAGDIFGTSRLETCSDRIEGLKQKLHDNDEAIASKAYPLWLFMFGTEENPWSRDDVDAFMSAHEMENFYPGMKQGVRGDVDVNTISGEVADISEYLEFDLDYIMTCMPMPKYTLGAFETHISQSVSRSQERNINRQLKEVRREVEDRMSPVVQQMAEQKFGIAHDEAESIRFKLGRAEEEKEDQTPGTQVIRYVSDTDSNTKTTRRAEGDGGDGSDEEASVWSAALDTEQLADPRLVSTSEEQERLQEQLGDIMKTYRDELLSEIQENPSRDMLDSEASRIMDAVIRNSELTRNTEEVMEEVIRDTIDTLGQDNQNVTLEVTYGFRHRRSVSESSRRVSNDLESVLRQLKKRMVQISSQDGVDSVEQAVKRINEKFTNGYIENRARMIAQMQIQQTIEEEKMAEFEQDDSVAAVKPVNAHPETDLCSHLTGEHGEAAVASLDESLSEQWNEEAGAYALEGFKPIPPIPPFHFGCDTELVPLSEEELSEHKTYTVAELEEKYGITVEDK